MSVHGRGPALRPARSEGLDNDYLEDPVFGLEGLRLVREQVRVPLATNTVVVNFEQLASNVLRRSADVVLLDTTFWGGIRPCIKACGGVRDLPAGRGGALLGRAGDPAGDDAAPGRGAAQASPTPPTAHYHQLRDDVIVGGKLAYHEGRIAVPEGPGLGVRLDRERLARYAELYKELGGYPYDRDPGRPGWYAQVPNERFADPYAAP
ncbi:enolase C-terminal domain-like protein [Nonomuraea dietziae]|uniref:enolase C-terminal domain-like protein n=1 Tax=Nonomuraea dietziae TaxID=65515 RepID=UPI0031DE4785